MNRIQEDIVKMMQAYDQATPGEPVHLDQATASLRRNLIIEESTEASQALTKYILTLYGETKYGSLDDLRAEIVDGLGDTLVVVLGTFVALGLNMQPFWDEIHRSNMSKLGEDGKPIKREDGKFLKGPNYSPPNIAGMLQQFTENPMAMWEWENRFNDDYILNSRPNEFNDNATDSRPND